MDLSLETLQQQAQSLSSEQTTQQQMDERYDQYLGKQWIISLAFRSMWSLEPDQKKEQGAILSQAKSLIEWVVKEFADRARRVQIQEQLLHDPVDASVSIKSIDPGHYTRLQATRRHIEDIFLSMGFTIEYGPEVVSTVDNFFSLNFKPGHPAIEMHDTFYVQWNDEQWNPLVLRTHGTAHYHDMITRHGVPLRLCVPSRAYRNEDLDASHDTCFMQVDAAVIDRGMSIAHFKDMALKFLTTLFEREVQVRMRPGYFPFVEPGFEIDATCPICGGDGCGLCKHTGWIEIMGAGMLHPNVLKFAGVDTDIYNGYAFGAGISRIVAIKYGIKDIRLLTNGDLRFIKSR